MAQDSSITNLKQNKKDKAEKITGRQKIIFEATVKEKTYFKAFIDGKEQEGDIFYPGKKIKLEANDVIQVKIGNGGALDVVINGKPEKLGKRGPSC
jgi:hypothetical protein